MRRVRLVHPSRAKLERKTARQWRRILRTGHRPQPFPRRPRQPITRLEVTA